jgi:hypothetical protein
VGRLIWSRAARRGGVRGGTLGSDRPRLPQFLLLPARCLPQSRRTQPSGASPVTHLKRRRGLLLDLVATPEALVIRAVADADRNAVEPLPDALRDQTVREFADLTSLHAE